jgi:ketosteroid isomerase-like protein
MGNRQLVERYAQATSVDDFDTQDALVHDDYVLHYPQSGERIRGRTNRRAVLEGYPRREEAVIRPSVGHITGTDDQFIPRSTWPAWSVVHLTGSGDEFTVTGTVTYADGALWHFVSVVIVRDGKIWRETQYFAPAFEAADWRRPYVEEAE